MPLDPIMGDRDAHPCWTAEAFLNHRLKEIGLSEFLCSNCSLGPGMSPDHLFSPSRWPTLLLIGKRFGIGSNLRTLCTIGAARLADYFAFDWKSQRWNLVCCVRNAGRRIRRPHAPAEKCAGGT